MITKLVPDASFTVEGCGVYTMASAEDVTIPAGATRRVSTGLSADFPTVCFKHPEAARLDMSALLTAVIQENLEIAVHILNYGTDPVHIPAGFPLLEVREW